MANLGQSLARIQGEGEVYICIIEERGRTIIIASIRRLPNCFFRDAKEKFSDCANIDLVNSEQIYPLTKVRSFQPSD